MSQTVNAETSSTKNKRAYRKGNPLSAAEKKRLSVSRKKDTHKELKVYIENVYKEDLQQLCAHSGMTQARMIEVLIANEMARKKVSV